ncbi:prefoldin subunit 3, putative [Aspergillus fumigatus A1163]|uniref:Prefoldin subunit 3 n=2 Tax=Aspergillus fumigatus TaxID=746128 RepID=Q4WID5_ASPFU|nr:prefoldin subunit 3, putative [Aspergillus fumigatus Af293]EAL87320.1 prefoldin subunit 3, putative [Aspergillus fumigatus Af293]EDP53885.1 prefoldin subunit 3, putative [Aspergillus fumigatus A1163]KEY76807.1 prefoldin subunit 3 [Aspergillus fumigatus]
MADKKSSTVTTQTNPRGIPAAPFIDNVSDYVASRADVEPTLQRFQEMISKYQFMELNTQRRAAGLREKIPDIKKTLDVVRFLKMQKETNSSSTLETSFELNDTLYARAQISPADTDEVYLWLGANVMLAYPIPEAETMLSEKLSAAEQSLANCDEDLEFLREQITVRAGVQFLFLLSSD